MIKNWVQKPHSLCSKLLCSGQPHDLGEVAQSPYKGGGGTAPPDQTGLGWRMGVICQQHSAGALGALETDGSFGVIPRPGAGALFLATHLLNFFRALTFDFACPSPHLTSCYLGSPGCFCSIQTAGLCLLPGQGHQSREMLATG